MALLNGEVIIEADEFSNVANGKSGDSFFKLIGSIGNRPVLDTTHKNGTYSWYYNGVIGTTIRGIILSGFTSKEGVDIYNDWNFGKNDFAIDFNIRFDSTGSTLSPIFNLYQDSNNYHIIGISSNNSRLYIKWELKILGDIIFSIEYTDEDEFSLNTWYHLAFVREEYNNVDNYVIFKNGNYVVRDMIYESQITNIPYFNTNVYIGFSTIGSLQNTYIDSFRITKGHYRWNVINSAPIKSFTIPNREY